MANPRKRQRLLSEPQSARMLHLSHLILSFFLLAIPFSVQAQPDGVAGSPPVPLTAQQKAALNHVLYRSPQMTAFIAQARDALRRGDLRNGLRMLQQVLGDPRGAIDESAGTPTPPDSFVWTATGLSSQRREVLRLFETLTDEQLQVYEHMYGTIAADALAQATASGSQTQLQEVVRRCWPTAAGAQAVDQLATRLLDQGQAESAARLWTELAASRLHRFRISEAIFEKAAVAHLMTGDTLAAQDILKQQQERSGIRSTSAAVLEKQIGGSRRQTSADSTWHSPYGNLAHNQRSSGTPPWLQSEWSQSLGNGPAFSILDSWENARIANEVECIAATVTPIVVQDRIVIRDLHGVRGCDPATGRTVWRYDGTLSIPELATEILRTRYRTSSNSIAELAWAGNPAVGIVTSDGEHVFAIDWTGFTAIAPATQTRTRRYTGPTISATNQLVCLAPPGETAGGPSRNRQPVSVEPLWTAGGSPDPTPSDRLGGHLFVGPPMAYGDSVFVIAESVRDKELKLVRLEARTGRLQWMQTLGIIEQPMFASSQRFRRLSSCIPAVARGIAVCPTDAGFLVGVDTVDGELLWMQTYFEMRLPSRFGSTVLREADGAFAGFADPPHVEDDRVVYLPRHSDELHCYDLETGIELWHVPRAEALYVGAIDRDVIAVVERSGVRGVSLTDGSVLWQQRTGVPSGRGVLTDSGYLLPLKSGGVVQIDLETGTRQGEELVPTILNRRFARAAGSEPGTRQPRDIALARFGLADESLPQDLRPGNLLLYGQRVFSAGPQTLTAFPQAGHLLETFRQQTSSTASKNQFQQACLELLLGQRDTGKATLAQLANRESHPQRPQARWMLRNLILAEFRDPGRSLSALEFQNRVRQFQSLIDSPTDEQQLQFERIRWEQKHGDPSSAAAAVAGLKELEKRTFLPQDEGFESVVSTTALTRRLIRDALNSETPGTASPLQSRLQKDLQAALTSRSADHMRQFLNRYGDGPHAARVRHLLADRLILSGDIQAAELTLLPGLSSSNPRHRAVAQILYVALLVQEGLDGEAGRMLRTAAHTCAGAPISDLFTDDLRSFRPLLTDPARLTTRQEPVFEDFLAAFNRDLLAWSAYRDLQPLSWPVRHVSIIRRPYSSTDPEFVKLWSQTPRQIAGPPGIEFSILHSGSYVNGSWRLIDRYSGRQRGTLNIPSRPNFANADDYRAIGHLMPVGGPSTLTGVSLLEYRNQSPLWRFIFPPTETAGETLEPGPATPAMCVFQTRKHLIAVDPGNGEVLWRRSDLDLESGVFVDRNAGLIGDDQVIVLFHRDQQSYTRLDAVTGARLNSGTLPIDFRFSKRVFGRKLFHISVADINSRQNARIWDPLTESFDLDQPIQSRLLHDTCDSELALLDTGGRLQVFRMPDVRLIADTQLGASTLQTATSLKYFSDDERFYINLSRPGRQRTRGAARHYPVTDTLPVHPLEPGLLLAVDRHSGRILWRRDVTHKSVLQLQQCELPFFVTMSRVQLNQQVGAAQTLDLEVIDRDTGETLAHDRNLLSDRFVHYRLYRDEGILQLHGLNSRIDLEFRARPRGILLEQQPL